MLTILRRLQLRLGRRAGNDAGMTLAEVIVSMTLLAVVGGLAMNYFVQTSLTTTKVRNIGQATSDGRVALSAVANLLRLADTPTNQAGYSTGRFETIATNKVVFYSNLATRTGSGSRPAPTKIVLFASAGKLTEQTYAPKVPFPADYTTNYPTTATTTQVLLSTLANTTVFTYCSSDIDPASGNCNPAATGASVASVIVKFTLKGLAGEPSQVFTTKIGITGALS